MKKLNVLIITIILGVLTSSVCLAGQKYISGFVGVNFPVGSDTHLINSIGTDIFREEKHDSGITFGGAFGYDFGNDFRIEEEITYRNNDVDPFNLPVGLTIKNTNLSFMTNGYFDIDLGIPLKPYLGAGIGFSSIEREVTSPSFGTAKDKDTVLAYQLMAGLGFEINPMITITAGYRYFVTSESRFLFTTPGQLPLVDSEFQSHEFMGGIRVTF